MLSILRPFQVVISYLFSSGSTPVRDESFPPGKETVIAVQPAAMQGLQIYAKPVTARKAATVPLPYGQVPPPSPAIVPLSQR